MSWGRKPQETHQKSIRTKKKMQQIHITQDQYTIINCIPLAKNYKKEENSTHNIIRKNNMLRNKCNREVHDFVYWKVQNIEREILQDLNKQEDISHS